MGSVVGHFQIEQPHLAAHRKLFTASHRVGQFVSTRAAKWETAESQPSEAGFVYRRTTLVASHICLSRSCTLKMPPRHGRRMAILFGAPDLLATSGGRG